MGSGYPISFVKINLLTLELLPLLGNYNAKPILVFCNELYFTQSCYISQLATIDHDCPVPIDKHASVKYNAQPLWTLRWCQRPNI